jgi:MscS family membrane protein
MLQFRNLPVEWRAPPVTEWRQPHVVRHCGIVVAAVCLLLASDAVPLPAQDPPQADTVADVSPASPRAALEQYLSLAREGDFAGAAAYLDVPDSVRAPAATLARQLKAVLDRHLWFDLEQISGAFAGDTTDGLPRGIEQIGTIPWRDGTAQPVRLVRVADAAEIAWRFSRGTVARVPAWYASLEDRWVQEHLPAVLLRPGPFDILWWQWLALPILACLSLILGSVLGRGVRWGIARVVARTSTAFDDDLLQRLAAPLTAALALALFAALLPWPGLYAPAEATLYRGVRAGFFLIFFWSLWRLIDVARGVLATTRWALASASSRALLPLAARVAKVVVLAIAAVAVLSLLGYPIASLIAGLGLGGLAVALAAQKTVENLFGAFSIGIDQPFREGDFVKIEDFVATVEAVGLRSTRFRTLDRTVITIPNGRLADSRIESFTARDRLRFAAIIGLVYETRADQMRHVLAGFERVLRAHPLIWPDAVVVRFREFAASSLDIEVMAWFRTTDWGEFQGIRQEVLLAFMDVVESAGSSFAFPTQTVHMVPDASAFRGVFAQDGDLVLNHLQESARNAKA